MDPDHHRRLGPCIQLRAVDRQTEAVFVHAERRDPISPRNRLRTRGAVPRSIANAVPGMSRRRRTPAPLACRRRSERDSAENRDAVRRDASQNAARRRHLRRARRDLSANTVRRQEYRQGR